MLQIKVPPWLLSSEAPLSFSLWLVDGCLLPVSPMAVPLHVCLCPNSLFSEGHQSYVSGAAL